MENVAVPDHGHVSKNLNISIIIISACFFIHRVYIRIWVRKNWGADDYTSLAAFSLLVTLSVFEIQEVLHGAGRHLVDVSPADLDVFFFNLPTMQLLYMSTTYMIKLSIILFLQRIHKSKTYNLVIIGGVVLTTIQAVVLFLLFALQCKPPKALWDKTVPGASCISSGDQAKIFYAHAGIGIGVDVFCLVTPMVVIWKHLMFRSMQIRFTIIFGAGLFAVVCAIIRFCVIVTVDMGVDTTFNIGKASIWTNLECFIGFLVSCAPSLAPTFSFFKRKITGQSSTGRTSQAKHTGGPITLSMNRTNGDQSAIHSIHHTKGSTGDIPMYSVSGIVKASSNDSEDNIAANGQVYTGVDFKVHVEKEIYTSKV